MRQHGRSGARWLGYAQDPRPQFGVECSPRGQRHGRSGKASTQAVITLALAMAFGIKHQVTECAATATGRA